MKKYFYPAKFQKEGEFYNVKFIDFDNIFTYGKGFEDAYYMAQDALYNMLPEYKKLPEPTYNYMKIPVEKDEFITMIELNPLEHEKKLSNATVQTTVTMPLWLKEMAEKNNISYSQILQKAIKEELNIL